MRLFVFYNPVSPIGAPAWTPVISTEGSQVTLDLEACVRVLGEGTMGLILPFSFTPTSNTNRNHQAHFTIPVSRFSPEIQTGEDGICLTLRKFC